MKPVGVELPHDLAFGATWPTRDGFGQLAQDRRVVPIVRRLLADGETPLGVYRKLAGGAAGTFLLESAEHGGVWSRYSIIGVRAHSTLSEQGGKAYWIGDPPAGVPVTGEPTEVLRETLEALSTTPIAGLPPLTSGMVGAISYDAVRNWEKLPATASDDLNLPDVAMLLATDLAVLDHSDGSVLLVANAINYDNTAERVDQAYQDGVIRLERMQAALAQPAPSTVCVIDASRQLTLARRAESNFAPEQYLEIVEQAQEDISAGEIFQVVLSQRFTLPCPDTDGIDIYRALRASNPTPYMYFLRLPHPDGSTYDVVGSSPEALVKVTGRTAITHPIAGTRPRGKSPEADVQLEEELLADPKERSEHVMLVDLGRNDLQRVAQPGSVDCVQFMEVRRYSHVMHLESTITGQMSPDVTAFDVLVATFPAGTLSGAPKLRAMELIERYEGTRRGIYGGIVGYLDFHGDMDAAIAIRTAVIKDGVAYVQAGAGVVADSIAANENQECHAKAGAVLNAIATATAMQQVT